MTRVTRKTWKRAVGALPRPALLSAAFILCAAALAQGVGKSIRFESILGVSVGTKLEEARTKFGPLGTSGGHPTRGGTYKEAWLLSGTDFKSVAYKTNKEGKIAWISGWLRDGKEIPFSTLGDLKQATLHDAGAAIWNVRTSAGDIRLVAKGHDQKARVVSLFSLAVGPLE